MARPDVPFRLDPARTALVVIDMQNDFCRVGAPLEVPDSRATIPLIQELLRYARREGLPVIFTRFVAGPKPTLVWYYDQVIEAPTHFCVPGHHRYYPDVDRKLSVIDVVDELRPAAGEYVVDKYGYSAFHNTRLEDILRAHHADTILICGTATNVCCESAARDAFHRQLYVGFLSDANSTFSRAAHEATLNNIRGFFGRVLTTDEALQELAAAGVRRG